LIGFRCKRSNAFSRELLIDRKFYLPAHNFSTNNFFLTSRNELLGNFYRQGLESISWLPKSEPKIRISNFAGVLPRCDPPDSIPNSEVKASRPDDT